MGTKSEQSRAAANRLLHNKPVPVRDLDTAHATVPRIREDLAPDRADRVGNVADVTEQLHSQCLDTSSDQRQPTPQACPRHHTGVAASAVPDFMLNQNAVLGDSCRWRHGKTPNYEAANTRFAKERKFKHAPGALADMLSNLVKNWEKEASYKLDSRDWRTIDHRCYQFSCNGGEKHTAAEMVQIGTYNALIGEHAFYSSSNTSFDDSHKIFREAMPGGFPWEVTEVYSGPPLAAFKWRHWGEMAGDLVCPMGPGMKLTAPATHQPLEIHGIGIAKVNAAFQITDLEIFYDPHDLMAKLCSARSLAIPALNAASRAQSSHDGGKSAFEQDSDRWSDFNSEVGDPDTPHRWSSDLPHGGARVGSF